MSAENATLLNRQYTHGLRRMTSVSSHTPLQKRTPASRVSKATSPRNPKSIAPSPTLSHLTPLPHPISIIPGPLILKPRPRRLRKPTRRLIRRRRAIILRASPTPEPSRRRLVLVVTRCRRGIEAWRRGFEAGAVGGRFAASAAGGVGTGGVGRPGGLLKLTSAMAFLAKICALGHVNDLPLHRRPRHFRPHSSCRHRS